MCTAHVSAVAQHECALLKLSVEQGAQMTEDSQRALQADILDQEGFWADAAILTVEWDVGFNINLEDAANRKYDEKRMSRFQVRKVVLVDAATQLPILAWAFRGAESVAQGLRTHFQPLEKFRFRLNRRRDGFALEKPGTDQRMEMVRIDLHQSQKQVP